MLRAALIRAGASPWLRGQVASNPLAARVARRFIAGDTLDQAEAVVTALAGQGATAVLDYLGENTTSPAEAAEATAAYLAALDRVAERGLDANVSVKLTAMGLDLDPELALAEAATVCARGKEVGAMVGIDMESHPYVSPTLRAVDALRGLVDPGGIGVCLQSYLYRTPDDLDRLNGWGVPVRLVKGAYNEPPEVAHQAKRDVDLAFARQLETLMAANPYPMVATHDPALIDLTRRLAARGRRDRASFEFQMLYGVRRDLQRQLADEGWRVRVYVPYGTQWYSYFMRRLAERPANLAFFLSSLLRR